MTDDDRDMEKSGTGTASAEPELGAIRGAFLAHQAQAEGLGGGSAGAAAPELVRGAYLSRLQRDGQRKRGDSVVGSEETGGSVLRGIYAARTSNETAAGTAPRPARAPARAKKAAPSRAKKAAPSHARKAAPSHARKAAPAKKRAAPKAKTAPKRKAAASRPKTARRAAPKRSAKKAARRR
ncbi:MAG: hypothetical protein ACREFQ_19995 [Stellaceae bacterium]